MKYFKSLLTLALMAFTSAAFTGCSEDEAMPPAAIPSTDWKANMTIADFKAKYWQADINYYTEVGTLEDGSNIILGGYICANDSSGNIYKQVVLQDATGALTIAVNAKDLYKKNPVGEEFYINATGLFAGKYAGLFQLGKDDIYTSGSNSTPQVSGMDEEVFDAHSRRNGMPHREKVYEEVVTIEQVLSWRSAADLQRWQSQLIRINGVSWKGGGTTSWGIQGQSAVNRYLVDAQGKEIIARNSGMSNFPDLILPAGHGDVVAIAGYYQSFNADQGDWQLTFRGPQGCIDFGGESYAPELPVSGDGTKDSPYSVGAVLEGAQGTGAWIQGYIVGWIDGQNLASGAKFSVPATVASNLLIATNPEETNPNNCIPVQLVAQTDARTALNLVDNPGNLGHEVKLCGDLLTYFGASGLKTVSAYEWVGEAPEGGGGTVTPPAGDTTYRKVTTITSGKSYLIYADGKIANPLAGSYGYLKVVDATVENDQITASADNEFTFTTTTGGYTIKGSQGRFVYQSGTYNSFNVDATEQEGSVWSVEAQADGTFKILNNSVSKWIQYDTQYGSYGSYPDQRGTLPELYEKVN